MRTRRDAVGVAKPRKGTRKGEQLGGSVIMQVRGESFGEGVYREDEEEEVTGCGTCFRDKLRAPCREKGLCIPIL